MNQPTDKQIEEVLAGIATPEDARCIAEWFATEEGSAYLDTIMTKEAEQISLETTDLYINHETPTLKMYKQIQERILRKRIKRICLRIAVVLIPVLFLLSIYLKIDSQVDLLGSEVYEEIYVPKGEKMQMMFQDGTRVYLNSDTKLRFPRKFALGSRQVYLEGEAYFMVATDKKCPFIVNLNNLAIRVLGTSFNVQNYSENKNIVVCLDEGKIDLTSPSEKRHTVSPGEKLIYNRENNQCVISRIDDLRQMSAWKQGMIVFKDASLAEVIKVLNRWYAVEFSVEDARAWNYQYTLTSDNTLLEKVLSDMEKITPVRFEYNEGNKEVIVKMK